MDNESFFARIPKAPKESAKLSKPVTKFRKELEEIPDLDGDWWGQFVEGLHHEGGSLLSRDALASDDGPDDDEEFLSSSKCHNHCKCFFALDNGQCCECLEVNTEPMEDAGCCTAGFIS